MRILLSNDDGVKSEGLALLRATLLDAGHEVWVVAPAENLSGCGHAVSCGRELKVEKHDHQLYSCSGYPADCVLVALLSLLPQPPELLISGPNAGANLADDVGSSGTAAAAREGAQAGIAAIALSALSAAATSLAVDFVVANLAEFKQKWQRESFWNINVPEQAEGVKLTTFGRRAYVNKVYASDQGQQVGFYRIVGKNQDLMSGNQAEDVVAVSENLISVSRAETRYRSTPVDLALDLVKMS